MVKSLVVAFSCLMAVSAFGQQAARPAGNTPTLEDLQSVKELLPLTPEEILALSTSADYKNDTIKLEAESYLPTLKDADKKRLLKKGLNVIRICVDVSVINNKEADPKKKTSLFRSGDGEITIIDFGTEKKLVSQKKEGLAKLCPT